MNIIKHTLLFIITYILFIFFGFLFILLALVCVSFVTRDLKPFLDFNFSSGILRFIFLISLILSIQFYSSEYNSLLTQEGKGKL